MKTRKVTSWAFLLGMIVFCSILFNSCKKDDPVTKPGTLAFHMHTLAGTTEVENYGDTIVLPGGRKITVSFAQLYISNIRLIKSNGDEVKISSPGILIQQGVEEYEIGDAPSGDYKTVRFDVGLSDSTNAAVPLSTDPDLYQPSMWFGASAQPDGFVFVNFQGNIDTTTNASGIQLIPFVYKIGTNQHRVTVTMPDKNYTVPPEDLAVIHLNADYAQILNGIELNKPENLNISTAGQNDWTWITDIESNIAGMFTYEE